MASSISTEPLAERAAAMDSEHRVQIGMIDALCAAIDNGAPSADVRSILDQLLDYSRAHFASEELLMRLDSYDGFDEHVEDHAVMIETLQGMLDSQIAGDTLLIPGKAQGLLAFLRRHIETRDRQYATSPRL